MTETTIRAALAQSQCGDVLESMFFLEALAKPREPTPDADAMTVQLELRRRPAGSLRDAPLPPAAANAIAADFLGEDAESLTSAAESPM